MSKSLADLRAKPPAERPERFLTLCLNQATIAKTQRLQMELQDVEVALAQAEESDESAWEEANQRDRRASERRVRVDSPETVALRAESERIRGELAAMLEEMRADEGEMTLRANLTDGEWRRWCNEHPARDKDAPGYERDRRVTFGHCNADDLIDSLASFTHLWNGERLADGDWVDVLEPAVATADKADMAKNVVGMYENRVDFHQWRNGLSLNLKKWSDSEPPPPSASPTESSTAGPPDASPMPTTETATASD